jgi:predicted Zn-dependent protease
MLLAAHSTDSDLMKLLEIGYAGLSKGYLDECHMIFEGLISYLPESPHPSIALAMVKFHLGQPQVAIEILESCIARFPTAYVARGVLAKFLYAQSNPAWQIHAQYVIEHDKPENPGWDTARMLFQIAGMSLPQETSAAPRIEYLLQQSKIRFA